MTPTKLLLPAAIVLVFIVAFVTKPSDKDCIIAAIQTVWGSRTPNAYNKPALYEAFMNLNSRQVVVDDWIFVKQIRYKGATKEYRVGIGAFGHIFTNS